MNKKVEILIIAEKNVKHIDLQKNLYHHFKSEIKLVNSIKEIKNASCKRILIINYRSLTKIEELETFLKEETPIIILSREKEVNYKNYHGIIHLNLPFNLFDLLEKLEQLIEKITKSLERVKLGHYLYSFEDSVLEGLNKNHKISLTEMENNFIKFLLQKNSPTQKQEILSKVWGHQKKLNTHALESLIYRLRNKIEIDPKIPKVLKFIDSKYFLDTSG